MTHTNRREKIAILGGGVGAMTTAFELTSVPRWQERYDITVYQMGWRLGGKGASGRNAQIADRIEEHGLHIWFGFYENAFGLMRRAYEELRISGQAPDSPFQNALDAFEAQHGSALLEYVGGEWKPWFLSPPLRDGLPGDDALAGRFSTFGTWDLICAFLEWTADRFEQAFRDFISEFRLSPLGMPAGIREILSSRIGLSRLVASPLDPLRLAATLARYMPADPFAHAPSQRSALGHLLDTFTRIFWELYDRLCWHRNDTLRRAAILLDFEVTILRGMIRDDVDCLGFTHLDDEDLTEWLARHGSRFPRSPIVVSVFDACFAYRDGSPETPSFAAGAALYGNLRMLFTYKQAICYRMRAGMGDIIFAPLYLVLKKRGVKFRFFHFVERLELAADHKSVEKVEMLVQAAPKRREYDPLVTVKGLPCWPTRPKFELLVDGEKLEPYRLDSYYSEWRDLATRKTLKRGVHFDKVVLGISIGALPYVARQLEVDALWKNMVTKVRTTQTQAFQLWLHKDAAAMGYPAQPSSPEPAGSRSYRSQAGPDTQRPLLCGYLEPFDTYADFSQVIPREGWVPEDNVRQIAYFCNCLPDASHIPDPFTDPGFPAREHDKVRQAALDFLSHDTQPFWPLAAAPGKPESLDWDLLVDRNGCSGPARFDSQFHIANVEPSERYVLSVPGSTRARLRSDVAYFSNLYVAGDWTFTPMNVGCVEAAVMSGMLASKAICGQPRYLFGALPHPWVEQAAPPPNAVRAAWQEMIEKNLPPWREMLPRNAAISAHYARWYLARPHLFLWSGVAAFASRRVGLTLEAFHDETVVLRGLLESGSYVADSVMHDLNLTRTINNEIFRDIGWAHEAYLAGGFQEVARGLEGLGTHAELYEAFYRIEQADRCWRMGRREESRRFAQEAAFLVARHEHLQIAQRYFEKFSPQSKLFTPFASMNYSFHATAFDPQFFTAFVPFLLVRGWPLLLRGLRPPDFVSGRQRVFWMQYGVLPVFYRFISDPERMASALQPFLPPPPPGGAPV